MTRETRAQDEYRPRPSPWWSLGWAVVVRTICDVSHAAVKNYFVVARAGSHWHWLLARHRGQSRSMRSKRNSFRVPCTRAFGAYVRKFFRGGMCGMRTFAEEIHERGKGR